MEAENRLFAKFERIDEFESLLSQLLALDVDEEPNEPHKIAAENHLFDKITRILDEHQEQSHLLDPYLERLVSPVINAFRAYASRARQTPHIPFRRAQRLSLLIYWYTKSRGYKTIVRFFPHQVDDLSIALHYIQNTAGIDQPRLWDTLYVVLLWLSLICRIPFDFVRFDTAGQTESTAMQIEGIGKKFLTKAGVEGDAAALLLARFYTRQDTSSLFPDFLSWSNSQISSTRDPFLAIGTLHTLSEIAKSSREQQILPILDDIVRVSKLIRNDPKLMANTLVRKWSIKLISRLTQMTLPTRSLSKAKGRVLLPSGSESHMAAPQIEDSDDFEVPSSVDDALEDVLTALQDRDTTVRWSAAKSVASISARLPTSFAGQVLDNILGLFSIHPVELDGIMEIPASAEGTWHGACLATAEFARRGLITDEERFADVMSWMFKALGFDVRKGAHSVGSSVRDAASYVVWSLARTPDAKEMLQPFAARLAHRLVATACFDREIHIRRAASAAFQEHVGRMGLMPHGIDVLRKTDFYAVSIRRNAFLIAAPQVATHVEYRSHLLEHLLISSIRHWDEAIRFIAAQSIRALCETNLIALGPETVHCVSKSLHSLDKNEIHGALLTLSELASSYASHELESERLNVFRTLSLLPPTAFGKYGNEQLLSATCLLIASSLSSDALSLEGSEMTWKPIVDMSLAHRDSNAQEAGAEAMKALSHLRNVNDWSFRTSTPTSQQSMTRTLGVLAYSSHTHGIESAVKCLLGALDLKSPEYSKNVEARRNACTALATIVVEADTRTKAALGPQLMQDVVTSLIGGLRDYTIDERGDVGSWIRIACIRGLGAILTAIFNDQAMGPVEKWAPEEIWHQAVGQILKQGAERLDNVRGEAGAVIMKWVTRPGRGWQVEGADTIKSLFLSDDNQEPTSEWSDPAFLFPRITRLMTIPRYRADILAGIILSIGSKNQSTQAPALSALRSFAANLPLSLANMDDKPSSITPFNLLTLLVNIYNHSRENYSNNSVFIPCLQALEGLGQADEHGIFQRVVDEAEGSSGVDILRRILTIAGKNADRLKNPQRIQACMRMIISFLPISTLRAEATSYLPFFLGHSFPTVRATTAEAVYLSLQAEEILSDEEAEEVEGLLLETVWSSQDNSVWNSAVDLICAALRSSA